MEILILLSNEEHPIELKREGEQTQMAITLRGSFGSEFVAEAQSLRHGDVIDHSHTLHSTQRGPFEGVNGVQRGEMTTRHAACFLVLNQGWKQYGLKQSYPSRG